MKKTKKMLKLEKMKKQKRDKIILTVMGSVFLLIVILNAIFELPYSGTRYEDNVLEQLHDKYKKDFVIVGKKNLEEDQYQILKVSPTNDPECIFFAKITMYKTTASGKFTRHNIVENYGLEDDYLVKKYIQYAPDIYFKNTGIQIDQEKLKQDYQNFVTPSTRRIYEGEIFFLESGLLAVKDVNKNNLDQKTQIIANIFTEIIKKEPFANYVKYDNDEKFRKNFDFQVYFQTTKGELDRMPLGDIYDKRISEKNIKSFLEYALEHY